MTRHSYEVRPRRSGDFQVRRTERGHGLYGDALLLGEEGPERGVVSTEPPLDGKLHLILFQRLFSQAASAWLGWDVPDTEGWVDYDPCNSGRRQGMTTLHR